jgi:signal transduction histidine kinase
VTVADSTSNSIHRVAPDLAALVAQRAGRIPIRARQAIALGCAARGASRIAVVAHACALGAAGATPAEIAEVLSSAPPRAEEVEALVVALVDRAPFQAWPTGDEGRALARIGLAASSGGPAAPTAFRALSELLARDLHHEFVDLVASIRGSSAWADAHSEADVDDDPRLGAAAAALVSSEPRLRALLGGVCGARSSSPLDALPDVTAVLSSSLDPERTLAIVARLALPAFGDLCAIDVLDDGRALRRVAAAHRDRTQTSRAREALPVLLGGGDLARAATVVVDDVPRTSHPLPEAARALGVVTLVAVPLRARGRAIGLLTLGRLQGPSRHRYDALELAAAEELGRRIAHALDGGGLDEAERSARAAAERASARAARLQTITAALCAPLGEAESAAVLLEHGMPALGALGGVVAVEDGGALRIVARAGETEILSTDDHLEPSRPSPIVDAFRSSHPLLFEGLESYRGCYPREAARALDATSIWVIPLAFEGRAIGVVGFAFPSPVEASGEGREFGLAIARQCAQALERARLLEAERRARADAGAQGRLREDVLAIVTHDLRNPLASIAGNAERLLRLLPDAPPRIAETTQAIARAAARAGRLIEDVFALASIDLDRLTLDPRPTSAHEVLDEALATMRPLAEARGIAIAATTDGEDRPFHGDRDRLQQVLYNLVGNAIKFTPEGGEIHLDAIHGDRIVRISVRDTGPGIADEDRARVFERYWQGVRGQRGGLGIGLFVARGIIVAHGGRMGIDSVVGRGSTFWFELPTIATTQTRPGAGARLRPRTLARIQDPRGSAEALLPVASGRA